MWEPLGNRVLVKVVIEEKTKRGILLSEGAKEEPNQGEVVAVGSDGMGLKIGDHVIFGKFSGHKIDQKGEYEIYYVLKENEILCREGK